jgi:hypothetical protein
VALVGADDASLVPLNSCYVITTRDRDSALALAAWLNCTWIRVAARSTADRAASGFARFNARVVRELPLPPRVLTDPDLPRLAMRGASGAEIQEELDDLCGAILALSPSCRSALLQDAGPGTADRGGIAGRRL